MDDLDFGATIKGFSPGQKIFGRYTLKALLGRGGMGVVWRARDESLERDVAVKMLPEIVANDPVAVRELKRETIRSQQLNHPHILRIYDFVEGSGLCGITMELVEGGTLSARRLEQPGEVFAAEALGPVVRQLCAALDYAHTDARIVHRDLKPANLMLDASGRLKVMDFGIAASLSESVSRVSNRHSSSGTPSYMSPQQFRGLDATVGDDLYSLGATLYELLAGQPPFKAREASALLHQVFNEPPVSLNERRIKAGQSPVPAAWEEAIMALLAKEPADRPQSAGEVAARLGLASAPNAQRSTSNAQRLNEERSAGRANHPDEPRAQPQTTNPKSKTPLYAGLAVGVLALGGLGWYFGIHAPEQKRLTEIARLESEKKTEEANRLRTEQEKAAAEAKARQEQLAAEAKAKLEQERLAAEKLAAARGGIVVRTTPAGAEVRVGAIALEKSPLTLKDQKLGPYPVRVRLDGYEEWTGTVEVKENDFADLDVALVRSTGSVAITSDPAGVEVEVVGRADLSASNRQKIRTPATLKLPTGAYDLTFRRPGWPEQKQRVEVLRNQALSAMAEFPTGGLELTSTPAGAEVWQDGRRIEATTPYRVAEIIPALYNFELRLKGFKPAPLSVTITARQTAREHATLEKQSFPQPGQSWENTLGQKFVPVPGTGVLFCLWETRERDYAAFVSSTGRAWQSANAGADHPAVNVSWDDAVAFCAWLTDKERAEGKLGPDQSYRLPTDAEWSVAVGLREGGGTPQSKDAGIKGEYPWGPQWPPPRGAGNYHSSLSVDAHERTAPVGSFTANRLGLHDLGGNVWEWCEDFYNGSSGSRVLRGASFNFYDSDHLLSSYRNIYTPGLRFDILLGFRVVVAVGSSSR